MPNGARYGIEEESIAQAHNLRNCDIFRVPNFGFVIFEDDKSVSECLKHTPLYLPPDNHRLNVEEKKTKYQQYGNRDMGGEGGRGGGAGGRGFDSGYRSGSQEHLMGGAGGERGGPGGERGGERGGMGGRGGYDR